MRVAAGTPYVMHRHWSAFLRSTTLAYHLFLNCEQKNATDFHLRKGCSNRRGAVSAFFLDGPTLADGIALCLSGGGYRAMLFHAGAIWRLNELALLKKINLVSSVSGGSITSGALAVAWKALQWDANGRATNLAETF